MAAKNLMNKDCRKFGRKILWRIEVHLLRECYGNCEIGDKTWWNAVIRRIHWSFFTTNVFYLMVHTSIQYINAYVLELNLLAQDMYISHNSHRLGPHRQSYPLYEAHAPYEVKCEICPLAWLLAIAWYIIPYMARSN